MDNLGPFEALIEQRGFVDGFIRVPGETRSNIKLVEAGGQVTDINGPGPEVDAAARDALLQRLDQLAPGHDAVVVAGSLPRGVSPEWLQALLQRLKDMGLKVAFDSSGAALNAGLRATPWLIKPNTEELGEAVGQPLDDFAGQRQAARRLLDQGIAHVVVSQGEQGVNWFCGNGVLQGVPPRVTVASTVGAGDSLLAGMLHGLLAGESAEATLRRATAIAAQAVSQIGFGINDRAQLARFEADVVIHNPSAEQEGEP